MGLVASERLADEDADRRELADKPAIKRNVDGHIKSHAQATTATRMEKGLGAQLGGN